MAAVNAPSSSWPSMPTLITPEREHTTPVSAPSMIGIDPARVPCSRFTTLNGVVRLVLAIRTGRSRVTVAEDTLMVSEAYGESAEAALKHALQVPKHDPMPLAALISAATTRLGVVATMSTLAYPPFMLARLSLHAGPHRRRPVWLEHRDFGRGHRGAELRPR